MDTLISHDWLAEHLGDPDLVVIDCTNFAAWDKAAGMFRTVSGRDHWAAEHISGSRHADFTRPGFSGDASRYRNTLPEPRGFADAMAALGVSDDSRVVLYDDAASLWAARVWWMLRWIGFDRAAILDGGWQTWESEGHPVADAPTEPAPGQLSLRLRPELFTDKAAVKASLHDGRTWLVDCLSAAQHDGREADLGLSGHIPGAANIPGAEMVDRVSECFHPLDTLAARFPEDHARHTILYCGSGIAAASVGFVMQRLGFEDVSLYLPGLQEWIDDAEAPIVTGR